MGRWRSSSRRFLSVMIHRTNKRVEITNRSPSRYANFSNDHQMKQSTNNLVYILFYNNLMYSLTVRFFTTVNHRKTIVEMRENLNF